MRANTLVFRALRTQQFYSNKTRRQVSDSSAPFVFKRASIPQLYSRRVVDEIFHVPAKSKRQNVNQREKLCERGKCSSGHTRNMGFW